MGRVDTKQILRWQLKASGQRAQNGQKEDGLAFCVQ